MMLHSSINDANVNDNVNVNVNENVNVNVNVNANDKNKINNSGSGSGSGSKPVTIILPQQYIPPLASKSSTSYKYRSNGSHSPSEPNIGKSTVA